MKKLILLFVALCSASQLISQDQYHIVSYFSESYYEGENTYSDYRFYEYDDQERLILELGAHRRVEYTYAENQVTSLVYFFLPEEYIYRRNVTEFNEDGYSIVESSYAYSDNEFVLLTIDSIYRDTDNQKIEEVEYISSQNGLVVNSNKAYTYNKSRYLIRTIENQNFNNTIVSDTTLFYYDEEDKLESILKRDYESNGFDNCELREYVYEGEIQKETYYYSEYSDCSDYDSTFRLESKSSNDIYTGFDYKSYQNFNQVTEEFEETARIEYTQEGALGDENIMINNVYYSDLLNNNDNRSENERNYVKSELVNSSDLALDESITMYPNITSVNSMINYEVENVTFNNIKIFNVRGQAIYNEPIIGKQNLLLRVPNQVGLYFVQLYNGQSPVTMPAKLIVR